MASGTSFKQQCPSCEAMVPIRDQGLIGRKIDCPKCKYRFVVEEPEDIEEEDEAPVKKKGAKGDAKGDSKGAKAGPRRKGEDKSKSKKGGGSPVVLYGGGALALLAVGGLIWGAIAMMGGEGGGTKPPVPVVPGQVAGDGDQANTAAVEKPAAAPVVLTNVTNLLPNDTQVVLSFPMTQTAGSAFKIAADESDFQTERFAQKMGFRPEEVNRLVSALNVKDDWVFTVLQTKQPYKKATLTKQLRLGLQPPVKSKSGKVHEVYQLNGELDSLGNLLIKLNKPHERFNVHFLDANTMVFADPGVLQKFLESDGKPEYLSKEPSGDAPAATPGSATPGSPSTGAPGVSPPGGGYPSPPAGSSTAPPGGYSSPPAGSSTSPRPGSTPGSPGSAPGAAPGMAPMPGMAGTQGSSAPAATPVTAPSSFMTIDPSLKSIVEHIEKLNDKKEPTYVVAVAALVSPLQSIVMQAYNDQLLAQNVPFVQRMATQAAVTAGLRKVKAVGASVGNFTRDTANVSLAVELAARRDAEVIAGELHKVLPMAAPPIKMALGLTITVPPPPENNQSNQPGASTYPGSTSGGYPPSAMAGRRSSGGSPDLPGGTPSPSRAGPRSGMSPPQYPGYPMGPGTTPPGGAPGAAGGSEPGEEEESNGTLSVHLIDRTVVGTLDIKTLGDAYDKLAGPTREIMVLLKGQADLTSTRVRYHDLAQGLQEYVNDKREFPRGTVDRGLNPETGLPYRPDQRLSFYATLLPFFGDEFKDWKTDNSRSWNEQPNLATAGRVLPVVLAHRLANLSPARVTYPGLPDAFVGTTHFVGIAGLGMDAPEYRAGDEATAKKLGIFGYDRITKRSDVKDGVDKTIALILVPDDHKAPWLAGGGATVRAVSDEGEDTNPLAPFVCINYPSKKGEPSKFDGKRGTLAIMGDGKVRFIPADLPAATFRALCTIAGGERIDRLDALCPVMENEERDLTTEAPAPARVTLPGTPGAPPQAPAVTPKTETPPAKDGKPAPTPAAPATPPAAAPPAAAPGQPGAK